MIQFMAMMQLKMLAWHEAGDISEPDASDRGDVPGWVLVTLMTAGLVVLIWAVAGPALTTLFQRAIESVSGV